MALNLEPIFQPEHVKTILGSELLRTIAKSKMVQTSLLVIIIVAFISFTFSVKLIIP